MRNDTHSRLTAGSGKTNQTVKQLVQHPMVYTASTGKTKRMGEIVYVSSRKEVEGLDTSRFLANFGIHQSASRLRQIHGRIIYTIHGYDESDEEVYEIPEVRRFYAAVHNTWPCWLYTACLASPSLKVVALSIVKNMSIKRSGSDCRVRIPGPDLKKFYLDSLPTAGLMFCHAGVSRQNGSRYLISVANHLGLPIQ